MLPLLLCHCNCCCCKKEALKLLPSTIPRQFTNQSMLLPVCRPAGVPASLAVVAQLARAQPAPPIGTRLLDNPPAVGGGGGRGGRGSAQVGVCGRRQVAPGRADLTRPRTATRAAACTGSGAPSCRAATIAQTGRQAGRQERYRLPNLPVPLLHNTAHHAACTAQGGGIQTSPPTPTMPTCCAARPSPVPCWPWWQPG